MDKNKSLSHHPILDPATLNESELIGVHEHWRHIMRVYRPCAGMNITCMNGRTDTQWDFQAAGSPAFSISILLDGHMQVAYEDGITLNAKAGSIILMASNETTCGWDILRPEKNGDFRLINIHIPQEAMLNLIGFNIDYLRYKMDPFEGEQSHIDAFLNVRPASSMLQRVGSELLAYSNSQTSTTIPQNLYLQAKALETIACFLHENITYQGHKLPVPADRTRLIEAYALLEKNYSDILSIKNISRAVGLNEKRLQSGFQALYGKSVHSCLTQIRLNAAITMLQKGISVTEAANNCGFPSLSHFSRIFRTHTGVTPKQYSQGFTLKMR